MAVLYLAGEQVEVTVTEPHRINELLDEAEAMLRQTSQRVAGILITRHEPGRYTLTWSDAVPFGETREQIL